MRHSLWYITCILSHHTSESSFQLCDRVYCPIINCRNYTSFKKILFFTYQKLAVGLFDLAEITQAPDGVAASGPANKNGHHHQSSAAGSRSPRRRCNAEKCRILAELRRSRSRSEQRWLFTQVFFQQRDVTLRQAHATADHDLLYPE